MPNPWVEVAVPVLAAALAIFYLRREIVLTGKMHEHNLKGTACIRKIHDWVYSEVTGQILARMTLEVRPPSGIPYPLWHVEWYIFPPAVAMVTEGLELAVRIDPENPKIIYPAVNWARRR